LVESHQGLQGLVMPSPVIEVQRETLKTVVKSVVDEDVQLRLATTQSKNPSWSGRASHNSVRFTLLRQLFGYDLIQELTDEVQ
jgi:hypothetical protein